MKPTLKTLSPLPRNGESLASLESCAMNTSENRKSPITGRFRGVSTGRFRRVFFILFTLLFPLTAGARDYDLWLGSTQVTDENKDNILNETKDGQPTAKYDPDTETLTLNEPTITGSHEDATIYVQDMNLNIEGCYHMPENANTAYGIKVERVYLIIKGNFTFYGSTSGVNMMETDYDEIHLSSGSLTAIGGVYGIQSCSKVVFYSRSISLTAIGGDYGLQCGNIVIDMVGLSIELKGSVKAFDGQLSLSNDNGFEMLLTKPEVGYFDNNQNQFYEADGTTPAKHVIFTTSRLYSYKLWLGETQVTSGNKDNILNQTIYDEKTKQYVPTAKYDPETCTLTLNHPTINGSTSQASSPANIDAKIYSELFTFKLKGSYHMPENANTAYGIYSRKESRLFIDGDFTFCGSTCGVYGEDIMDMESGTLTAIGGNYGLQCGNFGIDGVGISIELKGNVKAFEGSLYSSYEMLLTKPEFGYFDNNQFYESDGTTIAKHVIFTSSNLTSYKIWLGETEVTPENKDNILGETDADGNPTAKFDGNTLTLNNPTITGVHTFGRNNETAVIYSEKRGEFIVAGTYHQTTATAQYGIWCNSSHFYLGGDFTFRGTSYGLYADIRCTLLTNRYTVDLTLHGGTGAIYCPNFRQYDYLSKYVIQ